jgi:hypothetical protein
VHRNEVYEAIRPNFNPQDEIEDKNAQIRNRIAELQREIGELEAQLTSVASPR